MIINRIWNMPNKNTFQIKPVREIIDKYAFGLIVDPFANTNKIAKITNDIDPQYDTTYHMDAIDFLRQFEDNSIDTILFDPPFSPRQVSECYKKLNMSVNTETTQSSYWGNLKKEISRVIKPNGICISCGWNSGGIGKSNGFEIQEMLLVAHGGWHNDTIITVDKKVK